jgi:phosphoglycerate dehydrogenase-like enzyme
MCKKILITARSFRKSEGPHKQILRDAGYELVESPNEQPLAAPELAKWLAGAEGAILGLDELTAEVFDQTPDLRVVSRFGVGVDKVDLAAAARHGVVVTITPGANSVAVAELALALLLALARNIPFHDRAAKAGKWTRMTGFELAGSTLGIAGLGRIGREVARRAECLGMRVLYYDPYLPAGTDLGGLSAERRELAELLAESDAVSLHMPETAETRGLIGAEALARMKDSAVLINTARAGLVDDAALYEALTHKRLAGAASDVMAESGDVPRALVALDNFIATPHAGAATQQTTLKMGLQAAQNALAVLSGRPPEGGRAAIANPEVYARS